MTKKIYTELKGKLNEYGFRLNNTFKTLYILEDSYEICNSENDLGNDRYNIVSIIPVKNLDINIDLEITNIRYISIIYKLLKKNNFIELGNFINTKKPTSNSLSLSREYSDWNNLRGSLYVIEESYNSILAYIKNPIPKDKGLQKIHIVGILQILVNQQDAYCYFKNSLTKYNIKKLDKCKTNKWYEEKSFNTIRSFRDSLSGHPIGFYKGNDYNTLSISTRKDLFKTLTNRKEFKITFKNDTYVSIFKNNFIFTKKNKSVTLGDTNNITISGNTITYKTATERNCVLSKLNKLYNVNAKAFSSDSLKISNDRQYLIIINQGITKIESIEDDLFLYPNLIKQLKEVNSVLAVCK